MFMRGRPITMFIPSDVDNYDDIRTELPPEKLKLEWAYGYRGKDCRANVYLLPTGEIVYFIASVVVLFNYEERTQRHYLGHTDCVKWLVSTPLSTLCSPSSTIVVVVGVVLKAYHWKLKSKEATNSLPTVEHIAPYLCQSALLLRSLSLSI